MKNTRINGIKTKKQKIKKYRPVTLKPTKFSQKNKLLIYCNEIIINGTNKLHKIQSILETPLKQNKTRKILTKGTIVKTNDNKIVEIITKIRHNIPHGRIKQ